MGAMGRWQGGRRRGGGSLNLSALLSVIVVGLRVFAWNLRGDGLNDVLNTRTR